MGLLRKDKTHTIAKFRRTDSVICSHSRVGKTLSFSQINMVSICIHFVSGSLLLDLEASDLPSIIHRVVEDMVIHDQIKSDNRGQVLRMLLMKHK